MKKPLFVALASLILATAANAQSENEVIKKDIVSTKKEKKEDRKELRRLNENEVSYQSKDQLYRDFGDVSVSKWEKAGIYDAATFMRDGQQVTAYYDDESALVGTVSPSTFDKLPARAQKYINDKYKGYDKQAVVFFDDNEFNETDMILYNQQFDDADNYFVELTNGTKTIIVRSNTVGDVSYFTELR